MTRIEDLNPGTRVRVPLRGNAAGIVDSITTDRRDGGERPVAAIKFDGGGYGFNYPDQVEIIGE